MIIDVFNHFMPRTWFDRLADLVPGHAAVTAFPRLSPLFDLEARLRLLDQFEGLGQVLSLANPPIELTGPPERTPEYAQLANDALAEVCRQHPERFPAFIAALAMNNIEAALAEIDRAVGEQASEDEIWFTFGWPYETTACMTRLIFSGIFDELPALKIITHHMGGMIPYFAGRIDLGFRQIFFGAPDLNPVAREHGLKKPPLEYFKMLYADTALNGEPNATRCGHAFFRTASCLFATDAPFDAERGRGLIANTIRAVEMLDISAAERERIFAGNARALLKL